MYFPRRLNMPPFMSALRIAWSSPSHDLTWPWNTPSLVLSSTTISPAAEVKKVTGHSDAPDIAAFGDYWRRLDGSPPSLRGAGLGRR